MKAKVVGAKKIAKGFMIALAFLVFMALGGEVVKLLWNWLTPGLFGWHLITFWQALGLLALCRILFGGFGGRGRSGNWRRRTKDRWAGLTPEEREKFRKAMLERCFHVGGSTSEPNATSP